MTYPSPISNFLHICLLENIKRRENKPFDVTVPYPTSIAGTPMTNYIDWMRSCWYITFMSNPAISVPAGFTSAGLPVGIQIVGRHHDEWSVLQLAHAFEQATTHAKRRAPL